MTMQNMKSDDAKGIGVGERYPYPVMFPGSEDALAPRKGFGLCDDEQWDARTGANWWRTSTALLTFTRNAGTHDLEYAAAQTLNFFTKGQGQDAAPGFPATYVLTDSETSAFNDGSMIRDVKMKYLIYAFGFSIGRPFTLEQGTPTAPNREYRAWQRGYIRTIQEVLGDALSINIAWPDTTCSYQLDKLSMWPLHSLPLSNDIPTIGQGGGLSQLAPVRRPIIAGYQTTSDKVSIQLKNGMGIRLVEDVAFPTGETIVVPITCVAYGMSTCDDPCVICIDPNATNLSPIVQQAVAAELARRGMR